MLRIMSVFYPDMSTYYRPRPSYRVRTLTVSTLTKAATCDAVLLKTVTTTAACDAVLTDTITATATCDAVLQQTVVKTAACDALLTGPGLLISATCDAVLVGTITKTATCSAIIGTGLPPTSGLRARMRITAQTLTPIITVEFLNLT